MRKFSYCPGCMKVRWLEQLTNTLYRCHACETPVNLSESKRLAKKIRQESRQAKQKEMGTYESPTTKKKRKETRRRELDPEYVYYVHGYPCVVPGCPHPYPVHAHHVARRSQCGSDRTCIPLCAQHHMELHGKLGPRLAQSEWKVDFQQVIQTLNEAYERQEKGPMAEFLSGYSDQPWTSS